MSTSTINKQLSKRTTILHLITIWLIGAILVLTPLLLTQSVFIGLVFSKTMVFYSLTTVLIVIYSILIYFDQRFVPRLNKIGWLFLILIFIFTISTILSPQPYTSFWGTFERMGGLLTWLYYFAFFVVISGVAKDNNSWKTIIKIAISGTILVSINAFRELRPTDISTFINSLTRVASSLGNPIFLGGYLAMSLPLMLPYILSKKYSLFKMISFLALILGGIILFFTFSRGSWIAAILAVILVISLFLYKYKARIILPKFKSLALVFLIIIITLSYIGLSNNLNNEYWKNRIVSTISMEHRLHIWSIGLQAFKEKPLIGWGLESFKIAFNKYNKHSLENTTHHVPFQETHADRAHNEYIDMAVTGGIVALIIYILLIFGSLITNLRYVINSSVKNNPSRLWMAAGFAGSLLAYAIYVMSAFHVIVNIPWLLLALAWTNNLTLEESASSSPINSIPVRTIPFIVIVTTLTLLYYSVITPVLAVNAANKGIIGLNQGKIEESIDNLETALSYNSFVSNAIRVQSTVLAINSPIADQESVINNFYAYITEIADDTFITEPYNSYYYLLYGIHYGRLSELNPDLLEKAEYYLQKSAQFSPGSGEAYFQWGKMYFNLGKMTKAKIKLERALLLIPNNKNVYAFAGSFYILTGDVNRGITFLQKAIALGCKIESMNIETLLNSLEGSEEKQEFEQFYQSIVNI